MKDGFIKAAAITPALQVADPAFNREQIILEMRKASRAGAKVILFPELAITGATCGDLFRQELLLEEAVSELKAVIKATSRLDALVFVGTPWAHKGKLYSCLAAVSHGELLGLVPARQLSPVCGKGPFSPAPEESDYVDISYGEDEEDTVSLGTELVFVCEEMPSLRIAALTGADLQGPESPAARHAMAGAVLLVNGAALADGAGRARKRRNWIVCQSEQLHAASLAAFAGPGESTTDEVFCGGCLAAENGRLLGESERLAEGSLLMDFDISMLEAERRRDPAFTAGNDDDYEEIPFSLKMTETKLSRNIAREPFFPEEKEEQEERCREILAIQAAGLARRLKHTGSRRVVIGLSGGLDSTLALLAAARAFDRLELPREGILAVTMPCFGTTDRTYQNACELAKAIGAELREIPIREAVQKHFADIGQDENTHDAAYENAQARERTQVLMDIANQVGGLVAGTGDLSELALGWATYNGDHMSMYGVNAGVTKTMVRHLVAYEAEVCGSKNGSGRGTAGKRSSARNGKNTETGLAEVLRDILDTPVSPELLPPKDGEIAQKTEDLVGPYELHDFFLYYMLRYSFSPRKIARLAEKAFSGEYSKEEIIKWLKVFLKRFFSQQYKRSCMPDGPAVGSVGLSPRGAWSMPSDASGAAWLRQAETLQ